jgi:hypothetical protein
LERLNILEAKFIDISDKYLKAKEELGQVKSGNKYREMYLQMREINKDLKSTFA